MATGTKNKTKLIMFRVMKECFKNKVAIATAEETLIYSRRNNVILIVL